MPVKSSKIPLSIKLSLTAFAAALVSTIMAQYGPTNLLYLCDIALLVSVAALWLESSFLASLAAVGIVGSQLFWAVDFCAECSGYPLTGLTGYMFNPAIPLFTRALASFHLWLPVLLVWTVSRLGYDRSALRYWTVLAWGVWLNSYFLLPPPPAPPEFPNRPVNINYVYGFSDLGPQTWLPSAVYLGLFMIAWPLLVFWPTHWLLRKLEPSKPLQRPRRRALQVRVDARDQGCRASRRKPDVFSDL